jgi:hypothetical protein
MNSTISLQAYQGGQKIWQSIGADGLDQALAESDPKTVGSKKEEMDQTQVKHRLAR